MTNSAAIRQRGLFYLLVQQRKTTSGHEGNAELLTSIQVQKNFFKYLIIIYLQYYCDGI